MRRLFIGGLYARKSSVVKLWPSQVQAAVRALDDTDDLATALPTSAGKTRVAELCALSNARRVLIVTPLRSDVPGAPVRSSWRPTRQRFGLLTWNGQSARLSFDLEVRGCRRERVSGVCLIPEFDGAVLSNEWKDALWAKLA